MTRYLCAPDSFKESLTAMEAARAMAQGIENADHDAEVRCLPMADGGEGTARALVDATGGSMRAVPVHDPLGRPVEGHFGLLADGTTAVVETAEASGLALLEAKERNPLIASSYGTGELMLAAVRSGAKRIIVGLGGSATNDAGAGLLQALGVRLLDKNGNDLAHGGAALANLTTIDISTMDPALKNVAITAACDVTNPLTGPTGASAVFGPQKGASNIGRRPRAFCAGNRQPARRCRERRAGCRRGRWHRCSAEGLPKRRIPPGHRHRHRTIRTRCGRAMG